ncbi:MAG: CBS domain-containing protein [Chloroflexota bacterium]
MANKKSAQDDRGSRFIVGRKEILQARLDMTAPSKGKAEKMDFGTVGDWMLPAEQAASVKSDLPLLHAHEIMVKKGLSSLPVTENGRLLGVIFPKTISPYLPDNSSQTTGVASLSQAAQHATLGDVIKDEPLSVGVQTTIQEAAQLMLSKDMESIPVIDDDKRLLGIILLADILHIVTRS